MSAPVAWAKASEKQEMTATVSKTNQKIVVNLPALALGVLLSFNPRCGAGYADLP